MLRHDPQGRDQEHAHGLDLAACHLDLLFHFWRHIQGAHIGRFSQLIDVGCQARLAEFCEDRRQLASIWAGRRRLRRFFAFAPSSWSRI